MIRCGKTGAVLLYGTKCVGCDCGADAPEQSTFIRDALAAIGRPVGPLPFGQVMGFDVASEPDQHATIKVQRVSDRYEYRVEDIEAATDPRLDRLIREHEARLRQMREAAFEQAMWGAMPPRHANCRSRMDPRYGDGTRWTPPAQEIITDPNDRRGFDARPVRAA